MITIAEAIMLQALIENQYNNGMTAEEDLVGNY